MPVPECQYCGARGGCNCGCPKCGLRPCVCEPKPKGTPGKELESKEKPIYTTALNFEKWEAEKKRLKENKEPAPEPNHTSVDHSRGGGKFNPIYERVRKLLVKYGTVVCFAPHLLERHDREVRETALAGILKACQEKQGVASCKGVCPVDVLGVCWLLKEASRQ